MRAGNLCKKGSVLCGADLSVELVKRGQQWLNQEGHAAAEDGGLVTVRAA